MPSHIGRAILVVAILAWSFAAVGGERVELSHFSSDSLKGWESRGFDDYAPSRYDLVKKNGQTVLRARCDNSVSFFGVEQEINLDRTPVLHWTWWVDNVYSNLDEHKKSGDDYPARVYAVIDGGWLKWRTRAMSYVWASEEPAGSHWPNPYHGQAMMVAMQSGGGGTGRWVSESRNVKADFKRFYDKDADHIDGIALMTDCDAKGGMATAYFRDIYFAPE